MQSIARARSSVVLPGIVAVPPSAWRLGNPPPAAYSFLFVFFGGRPPPGADRPGLLVAQAAIEVALRILPACQSCAKRRKRPRFLFVVAHRSTAPGPGASPPAPATFCARQLFPIVFLGRTPK